MDDLQASSVTAWMGVAISIVALCVSIRSFLVARGNNGVGIMSMYFEENRRFHDMKQGFLQWKSEHPNQKLTRTQREYWEKKYHAGYESYYNVIDYACWKALKREINRKTFVVVMGDEINRIMTDPREKSMAEKYHVQVTNWDGIAKAYRKLTRNKLFYG